MTTAQLTTFTNIVQNIKDRIKKLSIIENIETHFSLFEKLVLFGLVLANAYVIYNWQFEENVLRFPLTDKLFHAVVALITAAALDGAVVLSAIGRRQGRVGVWAFITPYAIFFAVGLINYDVYSNGKWTPFDNRAALHGIFTFGVLSFANYLAIPLRKKPQPHKEVTKEIHKEKPILAPSKPAARRGRKKKV